MVTTYACIDCGKEHTASKPSRFNKPREEYRCPKCTHKNRRGKKNSKITCKCVDCGKEYTAWPSYFLNLKGDEYRCTRCSTIKICQSETWIKNHKNAIALRSQDPIWQETITKHNQQLALDPNWKLNQQIGVNKRSQDPTWLENLRVGISNRSNNPNWIKNINDAAKKRSQDPTWLENIIVAAQKRSGNPQWVKNNKLSIENNIGWINNQGKDKSKDPVWKEHHLISTTGQGFWYGHPILHDRKATSYCELWNRDLWNRIDAAWDFKSAISDKTKEDNKGRNLDRHHVYWQPKACCKWDEDTQGYYAIINLGTKTKPNFFKHYINGDPNKFVLLTASEHHLIKGNKKLGTTKLTWIKFFEDLIEAREKEGKKCYLTKEEYEEYKLNK